MEHVEVQVTCGSDEESRRIATALIERRAAACVQQVPIRSIYRWKGRVEHDDELLLLVKTTAQRLPDVEATIAELHSYDLPAVTVVPIDGTEDYLAWITSETTPAD